MLLQFFQIGDNGFISFDRGYLFFDPSRFPTNNPAVREALMIAPFWSDTDTRLEGEIIYRLIEAGSTTSQSDMSLLNFVSGFIAAKEPERAANFSASAMLVAQWNNVPPYPHADTNFQFSPTVEEFITQV